MRKTNLLKAFLVSIFVCSFSLSACEGENKGSTEPEKKEFELIPEVIDDKALQTISGYDELEKKQIVSHVSRGAYDEDVHEESESEMIHSFVENIEQYTSLSVFGDNFDVIDYEGKTGVPFSGSMIGFVFLQDISKTYMVNDKTIELNDAQEKNASSYNFVENFRNGAFIILKSADQENWAVETTVLSANRSYVVYYPDSKDVINGIYYQFISAAQFRFISHYETRTSGILWWKKTWEEPIYTKFNVIEKYDVVVAENSVDIRFTCESIDTSTISDDDISEEEINILQNSTTMTNGSTSTSYIKAEFNGVEHTVNYKFINSEKMIQGSINQTTTFTESGKYVFSLKTFFGEEKEITLYLLNLGEDKGKTMFFGDGIVDDSMRIYDPTKMVQTYLIGKTYKLIALPEYVPARYGNIYYFKSEADLKLGNGQMIKAFDGSREVCNDVFSMQGYYAFDFFNCNPATSSGDILHYTFVYYASGNSSYAPFVNYGLITNPARSCLLATKVIAVSLPTAGGGSYQFIYPYTEKYIQQAYEMAVKIEELSIEIVEKDNNKYYYYKSADNSNVKTNYVDKITMYEVLNKYALQNVNAIYLENELPFADGVVDDKIKQLNESSIKNTLRVVENQTVLADLRTGDIYLNNYKFTQVADFEVESIFAVGENDNQYNIEFDEEIDSLFSKSEKITITEKNWNKETIYQTIYSKNNTCKIVFNDGLINITYDVNDNGKSIITSSFKFVLATDEYDSQTLIAINDGKTRELFSMEEIAGLSLPKGKYTITVINRNKQTYQFSVNRVSDLDKDEKSFTKYNHDPLRSHIDESAISIVDEVPAKAEFRISLWLFIVSLAATALICILITWAITKKACS